MTSLMKQAIDGAYTDRFFGSRKKHDGYPMRLRAVVQNRLLDFRQGDAVEWAEPENHRLGERR